MAIVYTFDKDGGFAVGDTETRITVYAYPTSNHAEDAKCHAEAVANIMIEEETRCGSGYGKEYQMEYDARNWERLAQVTEGK